MATPQELYSIASCYLCFGISDVEALELALLSTVVGNGGVLPPVPPEAQFITTDAGDFLVTDVADFIITG